MSGHSKWSTIKHKKAAQDQKRGVIFSKLTKDITFAVKEGESGDPEKNPRLRLLLQKARAANMPSDNIKRAIDRGLGKGETTSLEEIVYEGYGPAGIAVLTVVHTDNRQRTSAEIKHRYERTGGSLGAPGSAMFLFTKEEGLFRPTAMIPISHEDKEKIRSFVEELQSIEDVTTVYSNADLS